MKKHFKILLIWIGLSILMTAFWIVGLMTGNAIFPSNIMETSEASGNSSDLLLLFTCFINTAAVLLFIYNSRVRGFKLAAALFLIIFSIQFFMSQIETVWFNDSLKMPVNTIWMLVSGGAIMSMLFALSATWLTGNFKQTNAETAYVPKRPVKPPLVQVALLAVVIWPAVYFLAGYFIAWQSPDIRQYYSGSSEMQSLLVMMKGNVASGLYFFQILRGVLWVLIAILVITTTSGSWLRKGLIIGLLLSFLGCSQLLLPNPIMPETVRLGHLLETSTSNFIWGFILSWFLATHFSECARGHGTLNLVNRAIS
jgi:hypothetical protein